MKTSFKTAFVTLSMLIVGALPATVAAAGTSTFSLQQSGNTISVYETSSVAVNAVEAAFSYTGSQNAVQSIGVATGSTFSTCTSSTSSSIVCAALGGNITGTNLVATLTIHLNAGATSASVTASMLGNSKIIASSDNTDTFNGSLPSATYNYTASSTSGGQTSQGGSSSSSNNSGSTASNTSKSSGSSNSGDAPTATEANDTQSANSGTVKSAATSHKAAGSNDSATVASAKSGHSVAAWTLSSILLLAVIGGGLYWTMMRRRTPIAVPTTHKAAKKTPTTKNKKA